MSERDAIGRVCAAIADVAAGRPVVVIDGADREDEGDLVFAAEFATPEIVAFMVRHTSGFICVAVTDEEADRLRLPPMVRDNQDRLGTAYCVTVDAGSGISTGISGRDRAHTIRLLAAAGTTAADLVRPGHVVPLRARPGGVLQRPGHTEAAVDLAILAGVRPSGALAEIVSVWHPTGMARGPELEAFAQEHGLTLVSIADLIAYRLGVEQLVERVTESVMLTPFGAFTAVGYRSRPDDRKHLALVHGDLSTPGTVPVHVHRECAAGGPLGAVVCDCSTRLRSTLAATASHGRGVVVYMRGSTGCMSFPHAVGDERIAALILHDLGVDGRRALCA